EEHFLFLDVPDALLAGLGVFVENCKPDGNFKRRSIGHAALFAFGHVVLQLQTHWVAAAIAERHDVLIEGSALPAKHVAGMERIGTDRRSAARVPANRAQV